MSISINTYTLLFVFSQIIFALGFLLAIKTSFPKLFRIIYIFFTTIWTLANIFSLISYSFTGEMDSDAVFYHLMFGVQGGGFFEYWRLIILVLAVILGSILLMRWFYNQSFFPVASTWRHGLKLFPLSFVVAAILIHPTIWSAYNFFNRKVTERNVFHEATDDVEFKKAYLKPQIFTNIEKPKNLVIIYAESFERTYFDEKLFPSLAVRLKETEKQAITFNNIHQVMGTSWTIAGIVASQCAVPLVTPSEMWGMDSFLANTVCLSDLLAKQGYSLNYIGGEDSTFAGKQQFLQSHSFHNITGLNEIKQQEPNIATSWWGVYDDDVLRIALNQYAELNTREKPFALMVMTLDTHHPRGHESKFCRKHRYGDHSNAMLNAVHCADTQLADFINEIREGDNAQNTVVVLVSDHLAQKNTAYNLLLSGTRRNMFMILPPNIKKGSIIKQQGSTLDISATVLPFLGFEGQIGLSRNLLENNQDEISLIHEKLNTWQSIFASLWQLPSLNENLIINPEDKTITVSGHKLKIPLLLSVNENLIPVPYFESTLGLLVERTLNDRYVSIRENLKIYINSCKKMSKLVRTDSESEFCLLVGKDEKVIYFKSLSSLQEISVDEIADYLN